MHRDLTATLRSSDPSAFRICGPHGQQVEAKRRQNVSPQGQQAASRLGDYVLCKVVGCAVLNVWSWPVGSSSVSQRERRFDGARVKRFCDDCSASHRGLIGCSRSIISCCIARSTSSIGHCYPPGGRRCSRLLDHTRRGGISSSVSVRWGFRLGEIF